MDTTSHRKLAEHAAPSSDLVTIVITDKSHTAAVIAGADVRLNFVKFVQNFLRESGGASYDDVVIEITQQTDKGDRIVLNKDVMIVPPNIYLVTLNTVDKEDMGTYTIRLCVNEHCMHSSIKLHIIDGKIIDVNKKYNS